MVDCGDCCQFIVKGRRFTLDKVQVDAMLAKLNAVGVQDDSLLKGMLDTLRPGQVVDVAPDVTADAFAEVLRYALEPGSYLLPCRSDADEAFRADVMAAFDFFGCPAKHDMPLVSFSQVRCTMNRLAEAFAIWIRKYTSASWCGPRANPGDFETFLESDGYRNLLNCMMMNIEPSFALLDRAIRDNQEGWYSVDLS